MKKLIYSLGATSLLLLNKVSALPMRTWNFGSEGYEVLLWQQILVIGLATIGVVLIIWFLYKRTKK